MRTRLRRQAEHILWPDEEPEKLLIDYETWTYRGCGFCGNEHHRTKDCPAKPRPKS